MRNRMLTGSFFEHEQRVYSSQLGVYHAPLPVAGRFKFKNLQEQKEIYEKV